MAKNEENRVLEVIRLLKMEYPKAKTELNYSNPLELLIATILSAQCTDERVNSITDTLFKKYQTAKDFANAKIEELEKDIKPAGFYHTKARNIKNASAMIITDFKSEVPKNMNDLICLPGVARKTANIVLSNAYGLVEGIAVDTHVRRLAQRLGFTKNNNPEKIEVDLMKIVPKDKWYRLTYLLINHGRKICQAKKPLCLECVLKKTCPSAFTFNKKTKYSR